MCKRCGRWRYEVADRVAAVQHIEVYAILVVQIIVHYVLGGKRNVRVNISGEALAC
ncbi:MAG: VCBS domain-containing protein [Spirochaetales bacterium]|nr:VCBS domain-containing protein [Spirochaetales bacterium]